MRRGATAGIAGIATTLAVLLIALPRVAVAQDAGEPDTLSLERAIRTALIRNPSITSAEASAATAAADRWAHWGALLPTASVNAGIGSRSSTTLTFLDPDGSRVVLDDPVVSDSRSNSAGLSFGLQLSAQTFTTLDAGGERREAAEYGVSQAQALVVQQVKVNYFEALKQQRLVEVARRQLEARREEYELTEDKYEIAAVQRNELLTAEIALRNAELQLVEAEDALASAMRQLRVAQGVEGLAETEMTLVEPPTVPEVDGLDVEALLAGARTANPELQRLSALERAASTELWAARASYLPTLSANLSYGRGRQLSPSESFFEFSPANTSSSFSVSLNWPLFNGFQRRQQNAAASNQLATSRAELRAQELEVEADLRRLVDDIRRGDRRLDVLERNVELAEEALELTREQYRIGSVPYLNLQRAIEELDTAEQAAFDQRYELLKRWAELEALGGDGVMGATR